MNITNQVALATGHYEWLSYRDRIDLARTTQDADAMLTLARDKAGVVRACLAENAAISVCPEAMEILARDPAQPVRVSLAENPAVSMSYGAVRVLAQDRDPWVRRALVVNRAVADRHPYIIRALAQDQSVIVSDGALFSLSIRRRRMETA